MSAYEYDNFTYVSPDPIMKFSHKCRIDHQTANHLFYELKKCMDEEMPRKTTVAVTFLFMTNPLLVYRQQNVNSKTKAMR